MGVSGLQGVTEGCCSPERSPRDARSHRESQGARSVCCICGHKSQQGGVTGIREGAWQTPTLTSSRAFAVICSCPPSRAGLGARCAEVPETPAENSCRSLRATQSVCHTVSHAHSQHVTQRHMHTQSTCMCQSVCLTFRQKLEYVVRDIQSCQLRQPAYLWRQLRYLVLSQNEGG